MLPEDGWIVPAYHKELPPPPTEPPPPSLWQRFRAWLSGLKFIELE